MSGTRQTNRRHFVSGLGCIVTSPILSYQAYAETKLFEHDAASAIISRQTVEKFSPDGLPRLFAGNTLICHLPAQCHIRVAVTAWGDALRKSSFAKKLACLPPDSYHMTIFSGPVDVGRSRYNWPSDIPFDAPIAECDRIIGKRIEAFRTDAPMPIRMRPDGERSLGSLRLQPADSAQAVILHRLRNRLADEVFRYRDMDHSTYVYHITLAYQLKRLSADEEREHQEILASFLPRFAAVGPFELGIPEYCTFRNMYYFDPVAILRT